MRYVLLWETSFESLITYKGTLLVSGRVGWDINQILKDSKSYALKCYFPVAHAIKVTFCKYRYL